MGQRATARKSRPRYPAAMDPTDDAIADIRRWLERAVIGLNLCPFAKAVHAKGQVRYVLSDATTESALLAELGEELLLLRDAPADAIDTTLLVHPQVLREFLDYNDFLESADTLVAELGLDGVLQVASFHPDYQFEGTRSDDVTNATNRSPYPTLHLLREASVDRAVQAFGDTGQIYRNNVRTLQALGQEGWARLQTRIRDAGSDAGQAGYPPGVEGHHSVRPSSS